MKRITREIKGLRVELKVEPVIENLNDSMLRIVLDGATCNSVNKDTIRAIARELYIRLLYLENKYIIEEYGADETQTNA